MIGKQGLVIKAIDYLDTSKILTLLTKDGMDLVIVRGGQKVTSHTFILAKEFQLIEYETKGKYLSAGKVISAYPNILTSYGCLKHALLVLELIDTFSAHITNYDLAFDFCTKIFDCFNLNLNPEIIELVFKAKFLYLIGVGPNFNSCVNCGATDNFAYFSPKDGGCVCKKCTTDRDITISLDDINDFRLLYLIKLDKLLEAIDTIKIDYDQTSKIIDDFYNVFLDYRSKSKRIIKNMNSVMR